MNLSEYITKLQMLQESLDKLGATSVISQQFQEPRAYITIKSNGPPVAAIIFCDIDALLDDHRRARQNRELQNLANQSR